MEEINNNELIYDDEEAIKFIINNISEKLRIKYSIKDIEKIIDLKFEYLKSVNIVGDQDKSSLVVYTADVDDDALDNYVLVNATNIGIDLSKDDLDEIWFTEYEYLEKEGLIGDLPLEEMN